MNRYDDYTKFFLFCFFLIIPSYVAAVVGTITSGQSLWWMTKRIGQSTVPIESCVDELGVGNETVLTSADVSITGTITILDSGNYCVSEDLTADVAITGTGVALDLNGHCINGIIRVQPASAGSSSITDIIITNGFVNAPAPPGNITGSVITPDAAITLGVRVQRAFVTDITIDCVDSSVNIAGRVGIEIEGDEVQVSRCTITSGNATERAAATTGQGPSGGDGILVTSDAKDVVIRKCIVMATGQGSNVEVPGTAGVGGDGGHGFHVNGADNTEIAFCTVMSTGIGNKGSDGSGSANAGDGGDGIRIESSSLDTLVHDCVLRNMGAKGAASGGANGIGIRDVVVDASFLSAIYRNLVYSSTYILRGAVGGFGVDNPPQSSAIVNNDFVNIALF